MRRSFGLNNAGLRTTLLSLGLSILVAFGVVAPAEAATTFSLTEYKVELWRAETGPTTIARYRATTPGVVLATTSAYSNRTGSPAGLLVLAQEVRSPARGGRCIAAFDWTGTRVAIGYRLPVWAWGAFEAGPCIFRVGQDYVIADEGFGRGFARTSTERSLLCLNEAGTYLGVLRYRGTLWKAPAKMAGLGLERCINLDGGSQLQPGAVNPAVVGVRRAEH